MALSQNFDIIPNQSVIFTANTVECSDPELEYKNIVNADDITQVQFELNPAYFADNLILYGDLTTVSGWTLSNMAHNSTWDYFYSTNDSSCYVSIVPDGLYAPFGENAFMKVDIGIITNTHGIDIRVGTQTYSLTAGQVGIFTFYGILGDDTATNKRIKIQSFGGVDQSLIIKSIHATPIDYNYNLLVRNSTTDEVVYSYLLKNYFSYTYPQGTDIIRVTDNKFTWSVDWGELALTEGCYHLEICDPNINTNLQNGLPNSDFNYQELNTLDYNTATIVARFNGDSKITLTHIVGIIGTIEIVTNNSPIAGLTYNYSVVFTDVNLSGGGITLTIGFVGDNDNHVVAGSSTKSGSVVSDGGAFTLAIAMSGGASCSISIANLTLIGAENYEGNWISNGFKLTDGECNTVVLHGCSDTDNAMGLNFGSSNFTLKGRAEGKFTSSNYTFDRETIEYGTRANNRLIHFKRKKTKALKLNLLPEYMLDFVSALVGLDHIYVDNTEFEASGDEFFAISYPDGLNAMAYVTLFLTELDTTIEKSATIAMGAGCSDTIECVLDPETDECLIDPQTGDPFLMP